jgi:O-antigen ligase
MPPLSTMFKLHDNSSKNRAWFIYCSLPVLFLYSPFSIDPVIHIRYIALSLYILVGFVVCLLPTNNRFSLPVYGLLFFIPWLLYWLTSIIGVILTKDASGDGVFLWLQIFMTGALTFILTIIYAKQASYISGLLKLFVIAGVIALAVAAYQLINLLLTKNFSHTSLYFVTSLFAHKNILAEILLLIFPITLIAFLKLASPWKTIGLFVSICCFMMIIILMSRAVWVAFAISLVVSAVLILLFGMLKPTLPVSVSFHKIRWPAAFLLILLIPFSILLARPHISGALQKQFRDIVSPINTANIDRLEIWKKTLNISKSNPLTGIGLGNWKIEILREGNSNLLSNSNISFYQRPHNDYLWILSEQGLIALLAWLFAIGSITFMAYRLAFYATHVKDRIFYLLINFSLVSYMIFSFFNFPKERMEHIVLLAILYSVIIIQYNSRFGNRHAIFAQGILIIPIVLISISLTIGSIRFISEIHLRKAYEYRLTENWTGVVTEIDCAYNCFYKMDFVSTPLMFYKGEAEYNLNNIGAATADFQAAEKVSPYHIHVLNDLGTCFEKEGNHEMAIQYFTKAITLSVYFEDAFFNLSAVFYNERHYSEALSVFRSIDPETKDPRYKDFARALIDGFLNQQLLLTDSRVMQKYFNSILTNRDWAMLVFEKSVFNHINYKDQLLLDFLWAAEKIDKDTASANEIRSLYFKN